MSIPSRSQTRISETVRISSRDVSTLMDGCLQSSRRARPRDDHGIHGLAALRAADERVDVDGLNEICAGDRQLERRDYCMAARVEIKRSA